MELPMENKYLVEDEFLRGANSKQEDEQKQHQHHFEGLMFAAMVGSAALVMAMLLFRRALLVSLLNQWRFLAINLLFLAIISLTSGQKLRLMSFSNANCTGKKADSGPNQTTTDGGLHLSSHLQGEEMAVEEKWSRQGKAARQKRSRMAVEGAGEMSKEELNRRAEAFIAMFRKQLVSDAMTHRHSRFASQRVGFAN